MTFVDDLRNAFDASDFCEIVKSGVGEGRISNELALKDATAVFGAKAALQNFRYLASLPEGPDVIASYISYSPSASEMFTALRAISVDETLTSLALDCLTCICRYSLDQSRPLQALEAARSVVKEIVKARSALIFDIFTRDKRICSKKALNLLRLVAMCHPLLTKEVVNRFDLSSQRMAPTLCTPRNNVCRVPFLDLMFVILTCGEPDVVRYLSTKCRDVIVTCLQTITQRTITEANADNSSSRKGLEAKEKGAAQKPYQVMPSHYQRQELTAAINFLIAIEEHIYSRQYINVAHIAFQPPVCNLLFTLASTGFPSISIAPRGVRKEHEALRSTASRLFISIAKNQHILTIPQVVNSMNCPSLEEGVKSAIVSVLEVINQHPAICKRLLENGPLLSRKPELSSRCLAHISIISACILRLSSPSTIFSDKGFFESCFQHSAPLIRHSGSLLALAFCRVVEKDKTAVSNPQKYLPTLDVVQRLLTSSDPYDEISQKLVASYQLLFNKNVDEGNTNLMLTSVNASGNDMLAAEDSIRAALKIAPREALHKALHGGYLSCLILQAIRLGPGDGSKRLWRLCRDLLRCTKLFPPGTEFEIDVYLSCLGTAQKSCTKSFEQMVCKAWEMPYGLYDQLHKEISGCGESCQTSLISVAALIRLEKLNEKMLAHSSTEIDVAFQKTLGKMLTSIVAHDVVLSRVFMSKSFLAKRLSSLYPDGVWWNLEGHTGCGEAISLACKAIQRLSTTKSILSSTYLSLVKALAMLGSGKPDKNGSDNGSKGELLQLGFAWDAYCDVRHLDEWKEFEHRVYCSSLGNCFNNKKHVVSTTSLLGLLIERIAGVPFDVDLHNNAENLKAALERNDFMLAMGALLRVTSDSTVRCTMALAVLQELLVVPTSQTAPMYMNFLYDSVLFALRNRAWSRNDIEKFLMFAVSTVSQSEYESISQGHISFSLRILATLLTHECNATYIYSRMFLMKASLSRIPPPSLLSPQSIDALLIVLPSIPSLLVSLITELSNWQVKDHSICPPHFLPLISAVLSPEQFKHVKTSMHFDQIGFCDRFLQGFLHSKTPWLHYIERSSTRVLEALRSIAKVVSYSCQQSDIIASRMNSIQNLDEACTNIWLLLEGITFDDVNVTSSQTIIKDTTVFHILNLLGNQLNHTELNLKNQAHLSFLVVFHGFLRTLRLRKSSVYSAGDYAGRLEKMVNTTCTNLMANLHSLMEDSLVTDLNEESLESCAVEINYVALMLKCIREILGLDLMVDNIARMSITSFGEKDGKLIAFCMRMQAIAQEHTSTISTDLVMEISTLIDKAVVRLPLSEDNLEVIQSLHHIERILSSDVSGFSASMSLRDKSVCNCMRVLRILLRNSTIPLPDFRTNYFQTKASDVLLLFEKTKLEQTCDKVLEQPRGSSTGTPSYSTTFASLDPFFVLRTFLQACGEASCMPNAPTLDLGRAVKEGPVGLMVTGMGSSDASLRSLAYACLSVFEAAVGSVKKLPLGSASGLYPDRKQLAFLLKLLRNSITKPVMRLLPLFVVWFRTCMRIALTPGHLSNKIVTVFFLRAPSMDVTDCLGLFHLLHCDAFGPELKTTRIVALEIIRRGVHTQKDMWVVRRRKIIDTLFMLAGNANGFPYAIRIGALLCLKSFLAHDEHLEVSHELASSHGLLPWLVQESGHSESVSSDEFQIKLDILRQLIEAFRLRGVEAESFAPVFSKSLMEMGNQCLNEKDKPPSRKVILRFVECGAAICLLAPGRRGLLKSDFSALYLTLFSLHSPCSFQESFITCISYQQRANVGYEIQEMLLEFSLVGAYENGKPCLKVAMIHAFIADSLLYRRSHNKGSPVSSNLCILLAKIMYKHPTVWLAVAAVCAVDINGKLSNDIRRISMDLPAHVPRQISDKLEHQFSNVVEKSKMILVEQLLSCSSSIEESL